jgi:hypothetical protein
MISALIISLHGARYVIPPPEDCSCDAGFTISSGFSSMLYSSFHPFLLYSLFLPLPSAFPLFIDDDQNVDDRCEGTNMDNMAIPTTAVPLFLVGAQPYWQLVYDNLFPGISVPTITCTGTHFVLSLFFPFMMERSSGVQGKERGRGPALHQIQ